MRYLFPTDEARKFICNNLFFEFSFIIKATNCINSNNITAGVRKKNYEKVKNEINVFLNSNNIYLTKLKEIYSNNQTDKIVSDLIIAYVFYLSNAVGRYHSFDIFKDKRSICYEPISIADML